MRFYSADDYLFFVGILKRLSDNLISETAECPFLHPGIYPGCFKKRGGRHSQSFRVLLGDQNGNVQETESFQQRFCMTQSLFAVLYGGKKTFLFVDGKGNGMWQLDFHKICPPKVYRVGIMLSRACLKNHFRNLQAPLCGIFYPHSVAVARYAALVRIKSPTN